MRYSTPGRLLAFALATAVVLSGPLPPTVSGDASAAPERAIGADVDPDSVVLQIHVRTDGTARWRVEYRVRLDDRNETLGFASLREDVESNPASYRARFADRLRGTVAAAARQTGRDMALANVTVSATRRRLPQDTGILTYTFEWTNFAAANGSTLRVGDALAGFPVDGETRLVLTWPDSYHRQTVVPDPDEERRGVLVWVGPVDFTGDEPRVVLSPAETTAAGTTPNSSASKKGGSNVTTTTTTSAAATFDPFSAPVLSFAGVAVLTLGAAGFLLARRRDWGAESAEEASGAGAAGTGPTEEAAGAELLSNEERVRRLLADHGGRLKQQEIADELDWSDAKTSRAVNELRDDGEVEVFRLGRENVVSIQEGDDD